MHTIWFCCLWHNVELCCHTHDSRTTVTEYSARPRLVGLALYAIMDDHDCLQRVALGRPIPTVNKTQLPSAMNWPQCSSYRLQSQIFIENRDFSLPHLQLTPHYRGPRWNTTMTFRKEKQEWCGYPMVKNFEDMFVPFERIHECDRLTYGQTDTAWRLSISCIASRGKKCDFLKN